MVITPSQLECIDIMLWGSDRGRIRLSKRLLIVMAESTFRALKDQSIQTGSSSTTILKTSHNLVCKKNRAVAVILEFRVSEFYDHG